MSAVRAGVVLAGFAGLTVPLLPVQQLLLRFAPARARTFPHWYHRQVCKILGLRLHINGALEDGSPVLLVANHTSWLDIPVLSAVAPVSFIAKKEVGGWPGVSILARLQRTVFVDRERRASLDITAAEIRDRLVGNENLVLFAEGTSSDGNRVLPFMSSLFAAAMPPKNGNDPVPGAGSPPVVQTITVAYTHLHGIPLGRADRPGVGWYGDMEMLSHAWAALKAGPLDVEITIGPPSPVAEFGDRKTLARRTEDEIRRNHVSILRHRESDEGFVIVPPFKDPRKRKSSAQPKKPTKGMR